MTPFFVVAAKEPVTKSPAGFVIVIPSNAGIQTFQ